MDKAPDAFRTISEVAADLDVPQHVLRFWESRFSEIKPMKRGGGRRYYRPDDVDLLRGIRHLLYGEGYTIRGVQRILKEQGLKIRADDLAAGRGRRRSPGLRGRRLCRRGDRPARAVGARARARPVRPAAIADRERQRRSRGQGGGAERRKEDEDQEEEEEGDVDAETDEEEVDEEGEDDSDDDAEVGEDEDSDYDEEDSEDEDSDEDEESDEDDDEEEDEKSSKPKQAPRPLTLRQPAQPIGGSLRAAISIDDMRKLESALDELSECRKLLEALD